MKLKLFITGATLSLAAAGWFSLPLLASFDKVADTESLTSLDGDIMHGAYLARASGCIACHTSSQPNAKFLAGGDPLVTPFGSFIAPNITSNKNEGLGNWTLDEFARAVRQGISPDGDPYFPAFPYSFYTGFSDQDIADLWAAFKTVPPEPEAAPEHALGFPFNQRKGLFAWQFLFFQQEHFTPPSEDARYNRGAFLVETATHCAACHTPRNLLGALQEENAYMGSDSMLEDEGRIPAITPQALKEAGWTELDLAYALKTGVKHDGDAFGGSMSEVVKDGTSYMKKEDLEAIAYYLFNRDKE